MNATLLPKLVRSTLGRVRVRGIPRLLAETSRIVLGNEPRMLRVAGGYELHIDPRDRDQCLMYYGLHGHGVLHFAAELLRPGDTAFDIGGQIGFFSAAFAKLVGPTGRIVSFEPDPRVWPRLVKLTESNPDLRIFPKNFAITAETGLAELHVSETAGWSTLVSTDGPKIETVRVVTHSLDDLIGKEDLGWERLRLIKIDVEGMELDALRGMRSVLSTFQPYLICEMNTGLLRDGGRSPDELLGLLRELGYTVQAIVKPRGFFRTADPDLLDVSSERDLPWLVGDLVCTPGGDL